MLRRITFITIFGFLVTFFSVSALAQDCDAASLSSDLADFSAQMDSSASVSSVLDEIDTWLAEHQDTCVDIAETTEIPSESVLLFTSEEEGNQPVLGPLKIEDGIYRIRLETDAFFVADLEVLEGECKVSPQPGLSSLFYTVSRGLTGSTDIGGVSSGDKEVLLEAKGCEAVVNIKSASSSWTLDFHRYEPSDVTLPAEVYSNDQSGPRPVLGPLKFKDRAYNITLTTEGTFSAYFYPLEGECDNDGELFAVSQGQASQGARNLFVSKNCVGFVVVNDAAAAWTLTFEPLQ